MIAIVTTIVNHSDVMRATDMPMQVNLVVTVVVVGIVGSASSTHDMPTLRSICSVHEIIKGRTSKRLWFLLLSHFFPPAERRRFGSEVRLHRAANLLLNLAAKIRLLSVLLVPFAAE